jgi:hypothetical protein
VGALNVLWVNKVGVHKTVRSNEAVEQVGSRLGPAALRAFGRKA